jgi:hypothetical protein
MKAILSVLVVALATLAAPLELRSQGYIVPNGVTYANIGPLYLINVIYNPTNLFYTGLFLQPQGTTPPSPYPNTFLFSTVADVGVRVFFVSPNQPVSLEPILSGSYSELCTSSYVFQSGSPFYVALYTGNQVVPPSNGIYTDPLFGWAELVNNRGVIELIDGAMAYKAGGIYAGTRTMFDVPEPSLGALFVLGWLLICTFGRKAGNSATALNMRTSSRVQ